MAARISDDCVACGACAAECPNDCIYYGDERYEINRESCVDCGRCTEVCPSEAITLE